MQLYLNRMREKRSHWLFYFWPFNIVIIFICLNSAFERDKMMNNNQVKLRSECISISIAGAKTMVSEKDFFDKYWNKSGGFENQFELKKINRTNVVIDNATNLMWHQSGSSDLMNLNEAIEWINELNNNKYAGKNTWRLPTLEEALSLLENQKKNGNLYIDSIFNSWQWCILTGDLLDSNKIWIVAFSGRIDWFDSNVSINYVRPVSLM